jgi:hypothetical protein
MVSGLLYSVANKAAGRFTFKHKANISVDSRFGGPGSNPANRPKANTARTLCGDSESSRQADPASGQPSPVRGDQQDGDNHWLDARKFAWQDLVPVVVKPHRQKPADKRSCQTAQNNLNKRLN